jgi:hypothetical protein
MVDQVKFQTVTNNGKTYEKVTIWVCGVPFSADLMPGIEVLCRKIATEYGASFVDTRGEKD